MNLSKTHCCVYKWQPLREGYLSPHFPSLLPMYILGLETRLLAHMGYATQRDLWGLPLYTTFITHDITDAYNCILSSFPGGSSTGSWQSWAEEKVLWKNDSRTTCGSKTTPLICLHYLCTMVSHNLVWDVCYLPQAYCVTEPGCGSDVNGIQTRAVKKGNEVYTLLCICVHVILHCILLHSNLTYMYIYSLHIL